MRAAKPVATKLLEWFLPAYTRQFWDLSAYVILATLAIWIVVVITSIVIALSIGFNVLFALEMSILPYLMLSFATNTIIAWFGVRRLKRSPTPTEWVHTIALAALALILMSSAFAYADGLSNALASGDKLAVVPVMTGSWLSFYIVFPLAYWASRVRSAS